VYFLIFYMFVLVALGWVLKISDKKMYKGLSQGEKQKRLPLIIIWVVLLVLGIVALVWLT